MTEGEYKPFAFAYCLVFVMLAWQTTAAFRRAPHAELRGRQWRRLAGW